MAVSFQTEVTWPSNPSRQKTEAFRIKPPKGVESTHVRSPVYVDVSGMSNVLKSGTTVAGSSGNNLGTVNGLVTSQIELRFESSQTQWRSRPMGGAESKNGPLEFTFQGGKVLISLKLGLYVLNPNKPTTGDTTSAKIFSVVYNHELLHVFDNLDMLANWFLPKLKEEPLVKNHLIDGKPWVYGRTVDPAASLEKEFHTRVRDRIETEAHNLWATEANRRQAIRDSPAEYGKVQDAINDLRSSYVRPK